MTRFLAVLLGLMLVSPAWPQAPDACAQFEWPVSRERNLFRENPARLRSGDSLKLSSAAAAIVLKPVDDVQWTRNPERAPKNQNSYGAAIEIDGVKAGLYQVTLSEEAWIDVIQNDGFLKAAGHSGKRGCAEVRKSVRFQFGDGPAIVQISGADKDTINFAIVPVE